MAADGYKFVVYQPCSDLPTTDHRPSRCAESPLYGLTGHDAINSMRKQTISSAAFPRSTAVTDCDQGMQAVVLLHPL